MTQFSDWTTGVQSPSVALKGVLSLFHRFQIGSGAHQASSPMGTRVSFSGGLGALGA
jgi:hypothetical protein